MIPFPRIRLRTLFVLFFCAAMGLATYPDPISALGPAVATAIIIGLIHQIRQLLSWRPTEIETSRALALILIVGIPTLNAFAFVFWLGPFSFPLP